jgi:hypothetical protein
MSVTTIAMVISANTMLTPVHPNNIHSRQARFGIAGIETTERRETRFRKRRRVIRRKRRGGSHSHNSSAKLRLIVPTPSIA